MKKEDTCVKMNEYTPWDLFSKSCSKNFENIMIIHKNETITYGQMDKKIDTISEAIKDWNIKIGALYLPNCIEFISAMLALNKNKKVVVPLSYQLKGESLIKRINYSDVEVIITDEKGFNELDSIISKINLRAIIVFNDNSEYKLYEYKYIKKEVYEPLDDVFGICFTSGSTSEPKGVVISNKAISGNALAVAELLKFNSNDRFLMVRPFPQAGPLAGDILMTISSGASMVILNDLFHPAIFLKAVEEYKTTSTMLVSTMLSLIIRYPKLSNYDVSSMKRIVFGGMIVPPIVVKEAKEKLAGISLYNTYGLTETSTRVAFSDPSKLLECPDSVGLPIKGCEIKIIKENGREALTNEIGEIYIKSDYIMNGYYKYEKLTKEVLTSKGFRSRDLGYKDENGFYYIQGRCDDLIIQGGNNVFPVEIEEVLLMNKGVKEAAVFGVDDERLGKKIVAFVKAIENIELNIKELFLWCRENLEDKKIPKEIHLIEDIPRNSVGKISKNDLRKIYYQVINRGKNNE